MRDFDTCDEKSFRDFSGNFSNRVKFRKKGSQINQKVLHKGVAAKKGNTGNIINCYQEIIYPFIIFQKKTVQIILKNHIYIILFLLNSD